jgi:hypothetical protein
MMQGVVHYMHTPRAWTCVLVQLRPIRPDKLTTVLLAKLASFCSKNRKLVPVRDEFILSISISQG